jgi:hypothetical protein
LFSLQPTGVSTQLIRGAAEAFLACLSPEQRRLALFRVGDSSWRAWSNIHAFVMRHGVVLDDCTDTQRERALDLVRATCSARGFALARDVMRLNDALGEITGRHQEYGEWFYWLSIFGEPSADEPWGWQIDGHHLIINCFVLGDQLVMTPTFMGSEPTWVESGKHAGTRGFEAEEQRGLEFARQLSSAQREMAMPGASERMLRAQRMDGRVQTAAFRDNAQIPYEGIRATDLTTGQREQLLRLAALYTGKLRQGHAELWLETVRQHLDDTHFMWMGGTGQEDVFYYRIHGPVILIEFDHQPGIAFDTNEPTRNHIHTVVRTPNGNDYGMDYLRQHHARFEHVNGQHVVRT